MVTLAKALDDLGLGEAADVSGHSWRASESDNPA